MLWIFSDVPIPKESFSVESFPLPPHAPPSPSKTFYLRKKDGLSAWEEAVLFYVYSVLEGETNAKHDLVGNIILGIEGEAGIFHFAIAHNEAAIAKVKGNAVVEVIGAAEADLTGKDSLGIVDGSTAKSCNGSRKLSLHPGHANPCTAEMNTTL